MISRPPLAVARPLRPIIRGRVSAGRRPVRRGAALVWLRRALRTRTAAGHAVPQPTWALTVNLFVRALLGLREAQMREPPATVSRRAPLLLRARPPAERRATALTAATVVQVLGTRDILQRVLLPAVSSLEIIRRTMPETVVSAVRDPLRLIRELAWARPRREREVLWRNPDPVKVTRIGVRAALRPAARPSPLNQLRSEAPGSARKTRRLPFPTVTSPRRRSEASAPMPARLHSDPGVAPLFARRPFRWRGTAAVPAQRVTSSVPAIMATPAATRPRAPVALVWPSRTADMQASVSLFPSSQSSPGTQASAGVDLTPVGSPVAATQPEPPNVDKVVDEVIRRLDRQYRVERMRRGL